MQEKFTQFRKLQLCYYAYFCDPCTTGKKIAQLDWCYSELGKMTDIPN